MKLYKLTEKDSTTYNRTMTWTIGKTNKVKKRKNPQLCSGDVIHAYKNKNLALLLNPIHANITDPILYECEGEIAVEDFGKCGVFKLVPNKKLKNPKWYINDETKNRVIAMFAILCAEQVIDIYEKQYPDDNRPMKAIEAAKNYLNNPSANAAAAAAYADVADIDFCKLADQSVQIIINEGVV